MRTAKVTAKPGENRRNRVTPGDKAARAEHHQAAPAAHPGRLLVRGVK
jgi:hypothetical protein